MNVEKESLDRKGNKNMKVQVLKRVMIDKKVKEPNEVIEINKDIADGLIKLDIVKPIEEEKKVIVKEDKEEIKVVEKKPIKKIFEK